MWCPLSVAGFNFTTEVVKEVGDLLGMRLKCLTGYWRPCWQSSLKSTRVIEVITL